MSGLQPSTAQPTSLTPQDNTATINALIAYTNWAKIGFC
jgi:hypothetical protein